MFPLLVIVAGLVGTSLMTGVMWFIHRSGWANADMIRALGSLFTRRYERSLAPGLVIHFAAGCVFAIPYLLIVRSVGTRQLAEVMAITTAVGIFHGAAMIFVLMALVAENHPVDRFRTAGVDVAAAHIAGHVAYGLGVGLVAGLLAPAMGG
jgi:hypothetical protein